jgi:2-polyprenyl-3-methyl-5-hydroxy-6-metoxy-1,4-benzoquinol methylase
MSVRAATVSDPWEVNASFWIQIIREKRDRYRSELTDPAVTKAIGSPKRLSVLDAGCGEGYLSRMLAKAGATVTGIDFSAPLIAAAKEMNLTDRLPITFDTGTVYDLPYAGDAFDLVVCNHLINDLQDPAEPIREFARVLRQGGRLIILMLHPCFYNAHAERDQATNGTIASSYFAERSIRQTFKVGGLTSPVANTAYLRSLEYYVGQLHQSSFVVTSLSEPHPTAEQLRDDPWWQATFTRPLFMLIAAELRREQAT